MLAIVEAVGSPDPTRSHFDAQDYMESGTPGYKNAQGGWLNRALASEPRPSPLRAVSLTPDLPITLRGKNEAVAVASISNFQVRDRQAANIFESLYDTTPDRVLNSTGRETFEAIKMMDSIQKNPYVPANGAVYPNGRLGQSLQQIARLIKSNVGLEVAFTDVGGWDTHVQEMGQRASLGQLPNLLREFGGALVAFLRIWAIVCKTSPSSPCPNLAAPRKRMGTGAPITATQMSCWCWVAKSAEEKSMVNGPACGKSNFMRAETWRSRQTSGRCFPNWCANKWAIASSRPFFLALRTAPSGMC